MKIEVLLSCMHQKDFDIVEKVNIKSDAVIINQCNYNSIEEKNFSFGKVIKVNTTERGLSKSRNMALKYASADVCLLCDDDEVLYDNYSDIITKAFEKLEGDVIVFNVVSKNLKSRPQEKLFKRIKRIPFYKSYSSVHIAFKLKSIINSNIKFDTEFGSGSGVYSFAEDSLFFADVHRNKLKSYQYPAKIGDLYSQKSSWFTGYNEKYFYETGAFLSRAYPHLKYIFMRYYPTKLYSKSKVSIFSMLYYIFHGIIKQEYSITYEQFTERFNNGKN